MLTRRSYTPSLMRRRWIATLLVPVAVVVNASTTVTAARSLALGANLTGSTDAVAAAVEQCAARKVPLATIYSDGFAEVGPAGRRKQERLLAIARSGGTRLIGPNCIGLFSSAPSCALSVNAVLEHLDITPGPLAIVSQSGSMMGGLLSRGLGRGAGFSKLVSVGNECDLGVGEITDCLVDDPHTSGVINPRFVRAGR